MMNCSKPAPARATAERKRGDAFCIALFIAEIAGYIFTPAKM
jgi:hypothetical protein